MRVDELQHKNYLTMPVESWSKDENKNARDFPTIAISYHLLGLHRLNCVLSRELQQKKLKSLTHQQLVKMKKKYIL